MYVQYIIVALASFEIPTRQVYLLQLFFRKRITKERGKSSVAIIMKAKEASSEEPRRKGPIHVLMTSAVSPQQQQVLLDPRLQTDYIAKRSKQHYHRSTNKKTQRVSVWDGVSKVERELAYCCEQQKEEADHYFEEEEDDERDLGGALDVDKEVQFAGILARDCHNMATKCLALAILERTMRAYREEEDDDDDDNEEESEDEVFNNVASDDERDDDYRQPGSKKRGHSLNLDPKLKRRKLDAEQQPKQEEPRVGRLERFFAAGGLKLLNRWLIEASTEESIVTTLKKAPGAPPSRRKPPPTRPLILPILRFLEHIPFDKKAVMNSNINKQIRNLGKEVDAIRKAKETNTHSRVDVQNWTLRPNDKDALDQVAEAIKNVKSSWGRMAKEDFRIFEDPFVPYRKKLKERLDTLIQFEIGAIPRPEWLEKPPKTKKLNTKELALKERQTEREGLKERLQAAQDEHREQLALLREKYRKRKEDFAPTTLKKQNGKKKKVVWKDGLQSQVNRNRKILEEVFVYIKNTPAAKDAETNEEGEGKLQENEVEEFNT
jgi:hypothetical protein